MQIVAEIDQLKNGFKKMIAVLPSSDDMEKEIQFGWRRAIAQAFRDHYVP
ncbi:hypothetical protein [Oxalobacter paraformigenes]|nr:hypothetical protein [Oxalobacter paraformigenes]